jgi:LacI family transcriptional regulator
MTTPSRTTPTSNQVAQRAGVSRATVSFVLNEVPNKGISEKTRQKVLVAARELGYQPNIAARSLAGGSTGTVAVMIPRSDHLQFDAYLPRLLSTVNDCCHAHGYRVLLEAADDHDKEAGAFLNLVRSKRIDGLIVSNMRAMDRQYVSELARQGFPVVVPGNGLESFYARYTSDNDIETACVATAHLVDLGHRRIAHIPFAPKEYEAVTQRLAGYEKALEEGGIAPDPQLVVCADISARSGYLAMQQLLQRQVEFTALFAGNDTVAIGAMRALAEAGRSVPQDVAIVGFDDIPLAAFAMPSLTTLHIDPVTQGKEAVAMLLAQMNGTIYHRPEVAYETSLIIRESCGFNAAAAMRLATSA